MDVTTTKSYQAINFAEKLGMIPETWSPRVVAELNDYQFKLVRIEGGSAWAGRAVRRSGGERTAQNDLWI